MVDQTEREHTDRELPDRFFIYQIKNDFFLMKNCRVTLRFDIRTLVSQKIFENFELLLIYLFFGKKNLVGFTDQRAC